MAINNKKRNKYAASLKNLLESTVDRRPQGLALVKVNGGKGALADALGSELEFL